MIGICSPTTNWLVNQTINHDCWEEKDKWINVFSVITKEDLIMASKPFHFALISANTLLKCALWSVEKEFLQFRQFPFFDVSHTCFFQREIDEWPNSAMLIWHNCNSDDDKEFNKNALKVRIIPFVAHHSTWEESSLFLQRKMWLPM